MINRKIKLGSLEVDKLTVDILNNELVKIVKNKQKSIIAYHNLHSAYLYHKNNELKSFYNKTDLTIIDGMGIIFLSRLYGININKKYRVTYLDWIDSLLRLMDNNCWKLFYLGSKPGVGGKLNEILKNNYPCIKYRYHHGYFNLNNHENDAIIKQVNDFQPNILMVGMGMPRQEFWIKNNFEKLHVNAILPSGACFDYITGQIKSPPRFLGKIGLEWLYRLFSEPKRLWFRYIIEPIILLYYIYHKK